MKPTRLQRRAEWSFPDILFCTEISADGKRCWFGSSDANLYEFDFHAEKPERRVFESGHSSYVTGVVRSGETLISCGYDRKLVWWDLESKTPIRTIEAHEKWIRNLTLTPDGARAITVADDMRCRVWDVATGDRIADFTDHTAETPHHYPSMLYALAVSADGKQIATGDRVGHIAIWDADTYEKRSELEAPVMYTWDPRQRRHSIGGIRSLAFSADGKRIAAGGIGKIGNIDHLGGPARLEVFDVESGERLHELEDNKQKGLIEQIAWLDGDRWIMTLGGDHSGFITVYDSESGELVHQEKPSSHVHAMCHDETFENLCLVAHQRVSHWTR